MSRRGPYPRGPTESQIALRAWRFASVRSQLVPAVRGGSAAFGTQIGTQAGAGGRGDDVAQAVRQGWLHLPDPAGGLGRRATGAGPVAGRLLHRARQPAWAVAG